MSSRMVAKKRDIFTPSSSNPMRRAGLEEEELRQNERGDRTADWPRASPSPKTIGPSAAWMHFSACTTAVFVGELCLARGRLSIESLDLIALTWISTRRLV